MTASQQPSYETNHPSITQVLYDRFKESKYCPTFSEQEIKGSVVDANKNNSNSSEGKKIVYLFDSHPTLWKSIINEFWTLSEKNIRFA